MTEIIAKQSLKSLLTMVREKLNDNSIDSYTLSALNNNKIVSIEVAGKTYELPDVETLRNAVLTIAKMFNKDGEFYGVSFTYSGTSNKVNAKIYYILASEKKTKLLTF